MVSIFRLADWGEMILIGKDRSGRSGVQAVFPAGINCVSLLEQLHKDYKGTVGIPPAPTPFPTDITPHGTRIPKLIGFPAALPEECCSSHPGQNIARKRRYGSWQANAVLPPTPG